MVLKQYGCRESRTNYDMFQMMNNKQTENLNVNVVNV